ncbi:hypothetical protein D9756_001078 [Leucocoprinus leucothites]|uniref:Rhodopsin domain-containing protein n=1 Tax=Leucocoprinus leucothites TaxID=201217 RepID=A0A8H5LN78_9AGAR|nr:hypothetical protein D9756_001078 [Leucoagaricus leucothites]
MLDLTDPLVQVRVACVACSSVAVLSTLIRLYIRRKRLWIDDAAALFSLLTLVVQIVAVFETPQAGTNIGVIRYYLIAVTFFCVLWSSRLSIVFSIIRINPFPEYQFKLKLVAVAFVIIPILLILQCFLICVPENEWKTWPVPTCVLDDASAICQLIADILSDGVLLFVPTRLLMILSDKNLRMRLILIFSTCVITSGVGIGHAIEIFRSFHNSRVYTAIIENNIALIVCNTPVILTSVIDLKEAPWEERHFLLELRNLEEGGGMSTSSPPSDDTTTSANNIIVVTATTPASRRNSRLVGADPLQLPDLALKKPGSEALG